jgi:hypothetical protein
MKKNTYNVELFEALLAEAAKHIYYMGLNAESEEDKKTLKIAYAILVWVQMSNELKEVQDYIYSLIRGELL